MILTCPDCATSYYVPDNAVGEGGRKVRCATCGCAWTAEPTEPDDEVIHQAAQARRRARPAAAPEPAEEEELEQAYDEAQAEIEAAHEAAEPAPEEPEAAPIFMPAAPAPPPRRLGPGAVQAAAWTAAAAVVVLAAALAVAFRGEVVQLWPRAAGAYARIGLPVNAVGLSLQEVSARRQLQGGRQALVVSGMVRNVRSGPVSPPPLSVAFLDARGRVLAVSTAPASPGPLAAGAAHSFSLTLPEPPQGADGLEVSFRTDPAPAP
jgi:predicted Zn finger-like uncharacterized protein